MLPSRPRCDRQRLLRAAAGFVLGFVLAHATEGSGAGAVDGQRPGFLSDTRPVHTRRATLEDILL